MVDSKHIAAAMAFVDLGEHVVLCVLESPPCVQGSSDVNETSPPSLQIAIVFRLFTDTYI